MVETRGKPLQGDRSAHDMTNAALHASDIEDAILLRHLPAPAAAGNYARDNSAAWVVQSGIPLTDLNSYARGSIIRGGAADWEAYDAKTLGAVLIGDGADVISTINPTIAGVLTVQNTGLHILDTNNSHDLIIAAGSDLTADRTLTLTTGDANRVLTLGGDLSIGAATSITGGGTIALGGFTLTVPATGTVALGTGGQWNVALWSDANTLKHLGALGTAGQYLRSAGAGADPAWGSIATTELPDPVAFNASTELTIAAGAITATQTYHSVDTQGDDPTDDLVTINGGAVGDLLTIHAESNARTVVIKHNTGNIWIIGEADISLEDIEDSILLIYDGAMWCTLGDGGGAGEGGAGDIELLFSQIADVTVANTTVETSVLGVGRGTKTIPANTLDVGTAIRLTLYGYFSDTGTPTLNVKVKLGGTEVCSTGVITLLSGISNLGWSLNIDIACRTTGNPGTVVAAGIFEYNDDSGHRMVKTTTTNVDTTAGLLVDVTKTWGAAAAGNTSTCQMVTIELLKADNLAVAAPSGLTAVEV